METGSIGFNSSSVGGAGAGANFGGATGIFRLFQSEFGGQVSWLLPAALISLVALVWVARPGKGDGGGSVTRMRAFAAVWGGWLLVTGLVFSFMQGIIHPYYMVALAPAIGALVGVGAAALWQARVGWAGRATAAVAVAVTAWWSYELLDRTPGWLPWLRWAVLAAAVVAVLALAATAVLAGRAPRWPAPRWGLAAAAATATGAALAAGLAGPLAYTVDTVNTSYTGSIPSAGPTVTGAFGGGPGGGRLGGFPGRAGTGTGGARAGAGGFPAGGFPGGTGAGNRTGTGAGNAAPGSGFRRRGAGPAGGGGFGGGGGGFGGGGAGGLSGSTAVSSALIKLLEQGASGYRWIAATEGTQEAAPIELATGGLPVVAIGGFNGSDPSPTLSQFEAMVARHEIHYYVGQGSNSFGGGAGSASIASWVSAHYTAQTVGGSTVYDLTKPAS